MIRAEVQNLVEMGPMPSSDGDATQIERFQTALLAISPPISQEEARVLLQCFGPDDCFGLAWSLVHLIETAPGKTPESPPSDSNEWVQLLWERSQNRQSSLD